MKALSIQQPWAWLIVNGYKDVENRTWRTKFRGKFLVHASKRYDKEGEAWVRKNFPKIPLPAKDELPMGGFVGIAYMKDCVSCSKSRWFSGPIGFTLERARSTPFKSINGALGFFNVDQ